MSLCLGSELYFAMPFSWNFIIFVIMKFYCNKKQTCILLSSWFLLQFIGFMLLLKRETTKFLLCITIAIITMINFLYKNKNSVNIMKNK